jgi:hypothetical protein
MLSLSKTIVLALLLGQTVVAHPGHDIDQEIAERNEFWKNSKRDLTHCNDPLRRRGIENKSRQRRAAAIAKVRAERGLPQSRSRT